MSKKWMENVRDLFSDTKKHVLKGYILYIFDPDKYECRLIEIIDYIKPNMEIRSTKEIFGLDKVGFYIQGLPVFICIKGVPFSMEWESIPKEKQEKLKLKDYTASEIASKLNSVYTNRIFSKGQMQFKDYLVIFLLMGLSACITYIITYMAMNAQILNLTTQLAQLTGVAT